MVERQRRARNPRGYYVLRDKRTGMLCPGGSWDGQNTSDWKPQGKVWRGTGPLKNYLRMIYSTRYEVVRENGELKGMKKIVPTIPDWLEVVRIAEIMVKPLDEPVSVREFMS